MEAVPASHADLVACVACQVAGDHRTLGTAHPGAGTVERPSTQHAGSHARPRAGAQSANTVASAAAAVHAPPQSAHPARHACREALPDMWSGAGRWVGQTHARSHRGHADAGHGDRTCLPRTLLSRLRATPHTDDGPLRRGAGAVAPGRAPGQPDCHAARGGAPAAARSKPIWPVCMGWS